MDTTEITALLERRCEVIHTSDLDRLVSFHTDDVVHLDLVPPLRYEGTNALRGRFAD